jgi:hypothetical protein
LDRWDDYVQSEKAEEVLSDDSLCMYFTMGDDVFGAPEESRLVFAKIKDPKDEDRPNLKDAMFSAIDLLRVMHGEKIERMFGMKDLPKIKVIDKETLAKLLRKNKKEKK